MPIAGRLQAADKSAAKTTEQPFFGMWSNRDDLADPTSYLRNLCQPRQVFVPPGKRKRFQRQEREMIFDTDVLIWASRGDPAAARTIDAATDRGLSIVSFMELLQGARSKLEVRQIQQSLIQLRFSILPLSESIGSTAAALIEQHALTLWHLSR